MRGILLALIFVCAACGDDDSTPPTRCGPAGECPTGQRCSSGFCIPGEGMDGGEDAATDAATDTLTDVGADVTSDVPVDVAPDVDPCTACGDGTVCRDGTCLPDRDGDGFPAAEDCDDDRADVFPGADERCTGEDRNCDDAIDDSCPCPAFSFEGRGYVFCDRPVGWVGARNACRAIDGFDLASLESAEEDRFVSETAGGATNGRWWIGLNDIAEEDVFVWSNGSPGTFRNWSGTQPDDSGGEDCVHINRSPMDRAWNDLSCTTAYGYVCEELPVAAP